METPIPISEVEKQSLVEQLSVDPRFSHGVLGRFDYGTNSGGHILQRETKGADKFSQNIFKNEDIYDTAFGNHSGGIEFRARIVSTPIEDDSHLFALTFNDRQGDKRPGSHTDYFFVVPETQTNEMIDMFSANPNILIEVFQKVFPQYDRSEGKLIMDPEKPNIIFQ